MWRSAKNYLAQALPIASTRWNPLLAVFYLTYRCSFRCPYCCDGENQPYYRKKAKELSAAQVLDLLAIVRRHCDFLVITGGEPLEHPEVDKVLAGLPALGFDGVVFTTNGYELGAHLEAVAPAVRYLAISVDSLDPATSDARYGVDGALARILENVEKATPLMRERGVEVTIASVATPHNLDDVRDVYHYAAERGFAFSLSPQLVGVKAHPELVDNPKYHALYDYLIAEKRSGALIKGAVRYHEAMRDFTPFDCRPSTVLALDPRGDVFYPCLERGTIGGNLLVEGDLHRLRAAAIAEHGPEPSCDNRCHSPCALGFALALDAPHAYLSELVQGAKSEIGRWLARRRT